MSEGVHSRRNSSAGSLCRSASGVRALWNAYRWLSNIRPAWPNAFFGSKLKTCATQSKTKASSIIGLLPCRQVGCDIGVPVRHGRGRGQKAEDLAGPGGQPVGGPGLVPDDRDVGVADAGLVEDAVFDLGQHGGREGAPAR